MPLTAEARERMEHTLGTSDHRSVTVRREDLRELLADYVKPERSWVRLTIDAALGTGALLGAGVLGWMGAVGKL